jgi:hypothetical protein
MANPLFYSMALQLVALHGTVLLAHYRITGASSRLMWLDMVNQTNHPLLMIGPTSPLGSERFWMSSICQRLA